MNVNEHATKQSRNSKKKRKSNGLKRKRPTIPPEIADDRSMMKYWAQRYKLFSRFDDGIKLDKGMKTIARFILSGDSIFCVPMQNRGILLHRRKLLNTLRKDAGLILLSMHFVVVGEMRFSLHLLVKEVRFNIIVFPEYSNLLYREDTLWICAWLCIAETG